MKRVFSCIHKTATGLNGVAAGIIFILMILTAANVLLRKLTGISITGMTEISELMMIILVFFALAQAEIMDRHVSVSLLTDRLTSGARKYLAVITSLANALFYALITAAAIVYGSSLRLSGDVSMDLQIPKYPFAYIIAFGAAVLSFVFFKKTLASIKDEKVL
ncbi:MAG TPA: TRAP transporter small permease [Smithellaceae bacterium]|nr:TRAP transporter small permease [Smithellaceae bacterium]